MKKTTRFALILACAAHAAHAQAPAGSAPETTAKPAPAAPDTAVAAPNAAPAAPPVSIADFKGWSDGIVFGAQFEGGSSLDLSGASGDGRNFGQLFTDYNQGVNLNQLLLTVSRVIDPKQSDFDVGFKFQGMYGTDARFIHTLGLFDHATGDRGQIDVVEANVSFHVPDLGANGTDLKVGEYPSPLGSEVIDASQNPFYSHSYIFDFGLPFKHTGGYATVHVNDLFDFYVGVDSGNQTTFGAGEGDNNGAAAGLGGFGLNLLDGKLTILGLTHIGNETPSTFAGSAGKPRYYNDVVITYKMTDKLTYTTELNYTHDDFAHANAIGAAQYVSYALSDTLTFNTRGEYFRDDSGFFVAQFPGNLDAPRSLRGLSNTSYGIGQATYGEATIGLTWKPAVKTPFALVALRPEIRVDHNFVDKGTFNGLRDRTSVTMATDLIVGF